MGNFFGKKKKTRPPFFFWPWSGAPGARSWRCWWRRRQPQDSRRGGRGAKRLRGAARARTHTRRARARTCSDAAGFVFAQRRAPRGAEPAAPAGRAARGSSGRPARAPCTAAGRRCVRTGGPMGRGGGGGRRRAAPSACRVVSPRRTPPLVSLGTVGSVRPRPVCVPSSAAALPAQTHVCALPCAHVQGCKRCTRQVWVRRGRGAGSPSKQGERGGCQGGGEEARGCQNSGTGTAGRLRCTASPCEHVRWVVGRGRG